jgi:hypothetical protein
VDQTTCIPINRLIDELQENASMPPSSSFFLVLDEAQLCVDMYTGAVYSEKEAGPGESRSVLREIFTSWDHFAPRLTVIFSGTGFSLTKITRSLASSMGTIHDSGTFTDTGAFVREEQQRAYIMACNIGGRNDGRGPTSCLAVVAWTVHTFLHSRHFSSR